MIYKKSRWLVILLYIFLIESSEGRQLLQYVPHPDITFTDIQQDVLKFDLRVPNDCQPKVWLCEGYQKGVEVSPIGIDRNKVQTRKYAKTNLKPKTKYIIMVEGCHVNSQQYEVQEVSTLCKPLEIIQPLNPSNDSVKITFRNNKEYCLPSNYHFWVSNNAQPNVINVGPNEIVRIDNLTPDTEYELSGYHMSYPNSMNYRIQKKFRTKKNDVVPPKIYFTLDHIGDNNKYYFKWNVTNQEYFGIIISYLIKRRFHFKACSSQTSNYLEDKHRYKYNQNEAEIILKPYSEYSFVLDVYGSEKQIVNNSLVYSQPISTKFEENFIKEEIPVMNNFETTKTDINVIFKDLNCTKLRGPMYLNYKAIGEEDWCESIALKLKSVSLKFPWEHNNTIGIPLLTPYCTYKVTFYVSRETDKWENATSLEPFTANTKSEVIANPIEDVLVTSKGKSHISFRWKLSPKPNGPLKEYKINFVGGTKGAYTADVNRTVRPCRLWPDYQCHNFKENLLQNDVRYSISIIPINQNSLDNEQLIHEIATHSNSIQNISVFTKESAPTGPYDVEAKFIDHNKINVSWKHPNETNGILTFFNVSVFCNYENSEVDKNNITFLLNNGTEDYKLNYFQVIDVSCSPEKHIKSVDISVVAHNTISMSKHVKIPVLEPPIPYRYNGHITFSNLIMKITKPNLDAFFNELFVFIAEHKKDKLFNEGKNELKKIQELLETSDNKSTINETCKINRLISTFSRRDKNLSQDNISIDGSNGLFKNETKYKITVFITNKLNDFRKVSHITLSAKTGNKGNKEENKFHTFIILLIISACSLFVLLFLVYIICRQRHKVFRKNTTSNDPLEIYEEITDLGDDYVPLNLIEQTDVDPSTSEDQSPILFTKPVHSKIIRVENLRKYIKKALENDELRRQHELFPRAHELMQKDKRITCYNGSLPRNKAKNRYHNILAFDHTIVKLNKIPGDEYSDYINANYINGYKIPRAYIATQGPRNTTLNDFWQMVWEQNIKNIVMITKIYEGDKKVCEQYWPEENEERNFNGIKVEFIYIQRHPTYDVRELKASFNAATRTIIQIQFKSWPAMGQPLYPLTLLPLLQEMLTLPYSSKSPILVHCSAGVGRTGTVILCDICLRMANAEGAVDILGSLDILRNHRPNMVDNPEQYKLAHLVILAYLTGTVGDTCIKCDGKFESTVEALLEEGIVSQNMAYLRESEWQDDAMKTVSMALVKQIPVVPEKNRDSHILPDPLYQIYLEPLQDNDETSYINAIRVNSFSFPDRFIVTQQPFQHTLSDFWRMVVEQQCIIIINLNEIDDNDELTARFWPEEESNIEIGDGIEIQHIKTQDARDFSNLTVRVIYRPNEFSRTKLTVEILNFKSWKNYQIIPDFMDSFVAFVADSTVICRKSHPVIVTCHDGASACGLYVALSNVIEQMRLEKECDVCKTVRSIRNCRKQFINKGTQLTFLYKAAIFYLNNFGIYHDLANY